MLSSSEPRVRAAHVSELDPATLYAILKLRVDVFVVEQQCAYPELDGRDLEPGSLMLWIEIDGAVAAHARLLADGDDRRIGRVVTDPRHRGAGLAAVLVRDAVRRAEGHTIRLDAQAHLEGWYGRFGFTACGPEFLEDGISHVPMVR
ncbi:ElaA protein [Microbacterium sorbitolivorans]|uniref:GNAT family N-acetyltransferase n=1 Tax=Microbacterium sorbitolivorans TaxID=1867410 RepID=A0A367Y022_9MICO|nr:GNAT family N-acetyltransferase [Microbacterium sorbitolivorans]RCK58381.1 GNAT family N-acetyltransferase [Microbacterium sorbitolivorans]GGF36061.1 ElaA protein [Microbacterium sorbitolivorans]